MKKSSLIGHTVELLDLIRPLKQPADAVARDFFRTRHYLGSKDRRYIGDTTFEMLRNFRLLNALGADAMRSVGLEQKSLPSLIYFMTFALRINREDAIQLLPDVRALWEVSFPRTECSGILGAIANARLPATHSPAESIALNYSFPDSIVEEWCDRFGEEETEKLCEALNQPAPTAIRVNSLKATVDECRKRLADEGIAASPTRYSPFGLVVERRFNAQALASYKDGWFELQDEGSQLLSMLLDPKPGQRVVDACAGGGGKTLHLAALMNNSGSLIGIDVDEKRLANIHPRLARAGVTIAELLHALRDNERICELTGIADAVLVDAPCSGVGTFRRNPAAKLMTTGDYIDRMATVQQNVLHQYAALVKPGGRLVYSTCTLLMKENEHVVENFLRTHPHFTLVPVPEILERINVRVPCTTDTLLLLPHITGTDGFFAAVMRRNV